MTSLEHLFEAIEKSDFGPNNIHNEFIKRYGLQGDKFRSGINNLDSLLACLEQTRESVSLAELKHINCTK